MAQSDIQFGGEVPDNMNEAWFDALIRHQVGLLRVSNQVRKEIFEILDATEKDVRDKILARAKAGLSTKQQEALISDILAVRSQAWKTSATKWRDELREIAKNEPAFLARALQTVSPVILDLTIAQPQVLSQIVSQGVFDGKVLGEHMRKIARDDLDRISQQLRVGMVQGETRDQIARRIVGSVGLRGSDGTMEITRRRADALTRTVVNGVANQAKQQFYKDNADVFEEELYAATLDGRTTPICMSLDGETFPIGKGPIPPLHFNCRSLRVAVISPEAIGKRPARAFTQRQLLREYTKQHDLKVVTDRRGLPRGHKGTFDQFATERKRQLTGQVDAKVTYQQWLGRQPKAFQDDTLGPTRAKLFRNGGVTLDKFVNRNGDEVTLSVLAQRESAAFKSAGLDPDDFT